MSDVLSHLIAAATGCLLGTWIYWRGSVHQSPVPQLKDLIKPKPKEPQPQPPSIKYPKPKP